MNKYKKLFEGKFTYTYSHRDLSFFESIYYFISPTTYTERTLYSALSKAVGTRRNLKILDVGCGGGHEILNDYGNVYGIDISRKSIQNAKKIYKQATVGDLTKKLRYQSNYFDLAFCSEVFGHIEKIDKKKFLGEINRVLKPGGSFIMSAETEGNNWLVRLLKSRNLYKKYWIDYQGHIGLLSPTKTIQSVEKYFTVTSSQKTSTWVLSLDGYLIFFEDSLLHKLLSQNNVRLLLNILMSPLYFLSIYFSSLDSANDVVVLAKK